MRMPISRVLRLTLYATNPYKPAMADRKSKDYEDDTEFPIYIVVARAHFEQQSALGAIIFLDGLHAAKLQHGLAPRLDR
jgi:hypothetical protein